MRDILRNRQLISVVENGSTGFSLLARIYPPELKGSKFCGREFDTNDAGLGKFIEKTNKYMKEFHLWDYYGRILKNNGPSYSFSSSFAKINGLKVSAIKIYPTSPHFNADYARNTAKTLMDQKDIFDKKVWRKNANS